MTEIDKKKTVEDLIETFLNAGIISLELRKKGLIKKLNLIILQLVMVIWKLTKLLLKKLQN